MGFEEGRRTGLHQAATRLRAEAIRLRETASKRGQRNKAIDQIVDKLMREARTVETLR